MNRAEHNLMCDLLAQVKHYHPTKKGRVERKFDVVKRASDRLCQPRTLWMKLRGQW